MESSLHCSRTSTPWTILLCAVRVVFPREYVEPNEKKIWNCSMSGRKVEQHSTVGCLFTMLSSFVEFESYVLTVVKLKGQTKLFCYKYHPCLPPMTQGGMTIALLHEPLLLWLG